MKHTENCIHHWHRVLGHRDEEAIQKMVRDDLATGVKIRKCNVNHDCECCMEGKMTRLPFPKQTGAQSTRMLELIHTDVCGPMNTVTPGGARYFMTIIDDFTRFCVVYFLEKKSEVPDKIEEFVQMAETRFGKRPAVIRADNGGEYRSRRLGSFYRQKGITAQFTAAYSPQQNGIAERKNRSLVEMARIEHEHYTMDYKYWAEAVNTANYVQNMLPTRATEKIPYEAWYTRKPDLKHMHIFGCSAFVHIPDQKRTKLEPKGMKLTFVGYSDSQKAYRLVDLATNKIYHSRDVRFLNESKPLMKNSRPTELVEYDWNLEIHRDVADEPNVEVYDEEMPLSSEGEDDFLDCSQGTQTEDSRSETDEDPETPVTVRRSERCTKGLPPVRYREAIGMVKSNVPEPHTIKEAMESTEKDLWKAAIKEELQAHEENGTWKVVPLPAGRKTIGCKWIFKRKEDEKGNVVRYKARLVAQGFTQKYGTDYDEVFAPVVKQVTFKALLSVAHQRKMLIKHIDVKTAYLNGELQEMVFMRPPPGCDFGDSKLVCHLQKGIYGLKQAAHIWNKKLNAVLQRLGFKPSENDSCLYSKRNSDGTMSYIAVYVDDLVVVCNSEEEYEVIVRNLNNHFKVTSLGDIRHFLGIRVTPRIKNYHSLHGKYY
ncbi:hypothetical protein RP20_CCG024584 [Aedes albopictus]|nr:hypothetical protein RP20_CCG024584 [Aedes albopictus]